MIKNFSLVCSLLVAIACTSLLKAQQVTLQKGTTIEVDQHLDNIPPHRTCGTMDVHQAHLDAHPERAAYEQAQEEAYQRFIASPDAQRVTGTPTIPVVFHVIYSVNANLVPASRLQNQIAVLNADFSRSNSDAGNTPAAFQGVAANTNIQFCLATVDPNGNPTTGINRVQSSQANTSFPGGEAALKSVIQWDPTKYLNFWVVENIAGGVLGYATFPSELAFDPQLDGVVVDQKYTGTGSPGAPFNLGRTATHEVGHWLGLLHTFQGNSCQGGTQSTCASQADRCCDTPPVSGPSYNCPSVNQNTCNETFPSNQNDMHMNYMDYVNDGCMNLFTNDQSIRMNFFLNGDRVQILTSNGCGSASGPTQCAGTDTVNYPVPGTLINYGDPNGGYVSGQNSYGDIAKAEYHPNTQNYGSVNGFRFLFGQATEANANSTVTANLWDESGGEPGQILHSENININDIINANGDITVMFNNPVTVNGAFFVGVEIDYSTVGDTVALISNTDGDSNPCTAWEQFSNGDWFRYDSGSSWGIDVSLSAHPVVEGLNVSVAPANPNIPTGGSVQLITTSNVNNVTHSWSPTNGLSCTNCANPVANPTSTTTYTLTTTDVAANCTTATVVTVTVGPVGIENDLFEEEVAAYPNPSNGNFMLEFNMAEINDLNISIYNNIGQIVYREELQDFTGNYRNGINLERVPAGVYHLRITNGERAYYQKLVIE